MMRKMLLASALLVGVLAAPGLAQGAQSSASAPPAPTTAATSGKASPSQAATAAAREALQFMFVDSGALDLAHERAFQQQMPSIRTQITSAPNYETLSETHRRAVDAVIETIPQIAREEFQRLMPSMIEETAVDTALLFSETEMIEISTFMRTSIARDRLVAFVLRAAERDTLGTPTREAPITPEQQQALAAFESTPSGQAFGRKIDAWLVLVERRFQSAETELEPALQERMTRGLCHAMGSEVATTACESSHGRE